MSESQASPPSNDQRDPSKTSAAVWFPIWLSLAGLAGSGVGFAIERYAKQGEREQLQLEARRIEESAKKAENDRLINEYLVKLEVALQGTDTIFKDLNEQFLEQGWGVLESYVIKAQRDGESNHALMRGRILRLVRTNEQVLTYLDGYQAHILNDDFKTAAKEFRDHAERYIDRWNAVPNVIATKGELPFAAPFPKEFPAALQREMKARKAAQ